MRVRLLIISSISLLLLSACQWQRPHIEQQFSTYLARIANIQDVAPMPEPSIQTQSLPDKRALNHQIPAVTLGILDSYQLRHCQLFHLIAERNSILGKVQDQFRNLDYQMALLHGLHHCMNSPEIDPKLKQQLTQVTKTKEQQLPWQWHNFLYTSDVMRHQLSSHRWYLRERNYGDIQSALTELLKVNQWVMTRPHSTPLPQPITPYQETLDKSPLLGDIMFSMTNLTHWLNTATQQLKHHDSAIWCGSNRDQRRFKQLQNVFYKYYVGDIQPYLASVDGAYQQIQLMAPLFASSSLSAVAPFPLKKVHQEFRQATLHHIAYWQHLFERCGVKVGK